MRLIDFFDRGVERFPNRDCLHNGKRGWTYAAVSELTHRIAGGLAAHDTKPGAKVAIYSPNHALAYACLFGLLRAGCVWVPINARNAIDENIYILGNTDTEFLFYHSDFETHLPRLKEELPGISGFVCIDREADLETWMAAVGTTAPDLAYDPDDVTALVSSGGTTGRPKGVMLSHRIFATMIANFLTAMPIEEPPMHLMVAPMTHAAGVTSFVFLAYGGTNLFTSSTDPGAILGMIERHRVSHLFLPPTLIYLLLAHPKVRQTDFSSLKNFIYAAAPMSRDKLAEAIEVFGPVMTQTYGQAEAVMICTIMTPADHEAALQPDKQRRLLSCGRPAAFTRVAIMNDDGDLLPSGEKGEIVVCGDLVMRGYYNNPQATEEAGAHGWHHTGDIGTIDDDGFVYIVDRKKDMIISGGFNVFPSEVEQVIWAHKAVQDCAVVGVPDEKWGEAVTAVVELKPGETVTGEDLIALCKDKLGSVKAPKQVEFWDALPRSPVGKVLKRNIRARFWEGRDRAV